MLKIDYSNRMPEKIFPEVIIIYITAMMAPSILAYGYKDTESMRNLFYLIGGLLLLFTFIGMYQGIKELHHNEIMKFFFTTVVTPIFLLIGVIICWHIHFRG